ncbi:AMP-binding protein [Nocardia sp. NPDC050435]|uniref:AMP-binding protein n=1 Tax=Nocardia sp. NPDC050435 TaxID=3155040 RepID=UPI0033EEF174
MKTLSSEPVVAARDWVDLLATRARHSSDRIAYKFLDEDGRESARLTYQELDRRARSVAQALAGRFSSGDRVILLYPAGLDYISAFFGCLYARVIAVPLFEPTRGRLEQIDAIARDCAAAGVLTTRETASALDGLGTELSFAELPRIATDELALAPTAAFAGPEATSVAYLQYTSGSTATPKGVVIDHEMAIEQCREMAYAWAVDEDSVITSWLPHFHDFGQVTGVLLPIYSGCSAVLLAPSTFVKNPIRWLDAVTRYRGTHSGAPNFAFDLCVDRTTSEQRAQLDLTSWRVVSSGAEAVRRTTSERFHAAFSSCGLSDTALTPGYGLAESTLKVTCGPRDEPYLAVRFDMSTLAAGRAVPTEDAEGVDLVGLGHTVLDTQIAIVAPESGHRLPEGDVGEIWVSGPCVARGYWNLPEESDYTFNAHIVGDTATAWMRTGDLGFVYAGHLFICGRLKNVMIVNGLNYYLEDIEATVVDSDPVWRAGSVLAFAAEQGGREDLVLIAEYRPKNGHDLDSLAASIHDVVAVRHGIAPVTVVLIEPGTVPRTTSGKLRRQQCMSDFLTGRLSEIHRWAHSGEAPASAAGADQVPHAMWGLVRQGLLDQINAWTAEYHPDAPALDLERSLAEHGFGSVDQIDLHERLESWAGKRFAAELVWDSSNVAEMVGQIADVLAPTNTITGSGR